MKRVFVGLSGGVDSAVSAALLKEQDYDVVGAFIKIWQPEFIECTWEKDRLDALRVCASLEIPFKEIDLSTEYQREIVEDLINRYKSGMTPNPDVLCNAKIKFGAFASWAFAEGADYVATGHYARVEKIENRAALLRGIDKDKDQSYFLWQIQPAMLKRVLFPIGNMHKADVRNYAARAELPNADRPDSQGLCFVGAITLPEFLSQYVRLIPGDVVDESGTVIGRHEGAAVYTLGQRHGFTITGGADTRPHYVVDIGAARNMLVVSTHRDHAATTHITLSHTQWFREPPSRVMAQVRYRESPTRATLSVAKSGATLELDEARIAAPGQSLVCYEKDEVLGGGIIEA